MLQNIAYDLIKEVFFLTFFHVWFLFLEHWRSLSFFLIWWFLFIFIMHRNSCDVEEQARKWQSTWLSCVVSGLTNTDRYPAITIPALFVLDVFVVAADVIN